jgi:hypothetical protein
VFPSNPAGSHRGTWKAVLRLRQVDEILADLRKAREDQANLVELIRRLREFAEKAMPFNLTVHSYSNLMLDATLWQDGFAPGAAVHLSANLWEYQVPLRNHALVWADILQPDGNRVTLPFSASGEGTYSADWITSRPGIYRFVIRAEGDTTSNVRFSREKILTAGVWVGGDQPYNPQTGKDSEFCEWILCLLEQVGKSHDLQVRLKELDVDLGALRKCIEAFCRKGRTIMAEQRNEIESSEEWRKLSQSSEFHKLVAMLASGGLGDLPLLEAAKTTPVVRKLKMEGSSENMFLLPEQVRKKANKK